MIDLFGKQGFSGLIKRHIPGSTVELSPITLGTMRLSEKKFDTSSTKMLIRDALAMQVDTHHFSDEYESFELLLNSYAGLKQTEKSQIKSICKLGNPHFDEELFNAEKLKLQIESYLTSTGLEQLSIVQWMWRLNPLDDSVRIERLKNCIQEMKESFQLLIKEGKVGDFACFPYSSDFMHEVRDLNLCKGQVNYLNLAEDDALDAGLGEYTIALRPLLAGKLKTIKDQNMLKYIEGVANGKQWTLSQHSLAYCLSASEVKTCVVSMHNLEQLKSATEVATSTPSSLDLNSYQKLISAVSTYY